MTKEIKARYFDGHTSVAQASSLTFDSNGDLLINLSSQEVKWPIDSFGQEKIGKQLSLSRPNTGESITLDDIESIEAFLLALEQHKPKNNYQKLIDTSLGTKVLLALFIVIGIGILYVFAIPTVAEKASVIIPRSFDQRLGNTFIDQYLDYSEVDSTRSELLQQFIDNIDFGTSTPLKAAVVEAGIANAFALPNGQIVVYTGLLEKIDDKDQLAALMAHEAAHVKHRHSIKMMSRNLAGYLFLSLVLSDVNGLMGIIADNVHQLQSLSYSRAFEKEADLDGISSLSRNQLDTDGMSRLFETLKAENHIGNKVPEFLSSHPFIQDRIDYSYEHQLYSSKEPSETSMLLDSIFQQIKADAIEVD